jgi:hypothetical protein
MISVISIIHFFIASHNSGPNFHMPPDSLLKSDFYDINPLVSGFDRIYINN